MSQRAEVFFHVGLGKTASTYLQMRVFPHLRGITYVPTARYRHFARLLASSPAERLLFSREFDRQFEEAVLAFAACAPQARPLIVLRRHDEWIASQYRRHVKNGWALTFRQFFDVHHDRGTWKARDLWMAPRIRLLEDVFRTRPLVLFHEELRKAPWPFLDRIATYTGTTYRREEICTRPFHTSYTDKQLRALLSLGRVFNAEPPHRGTALTWVKRRGRMLGCYALLRGGGWMPESWIRIKTLIPREDLETIRDRFDEDWQQCRAYARQTEAAISRQPSCCGDADRNRSSSPPGGAAESVGARSPDTLA